MKAMETIQDLIEEAKVRTVWWALLIFAVCYFLSHTSTSMLMNLPISVLIVCALRILSNEVEISWKVKARHPQTYLSLLEKKQLSVNDSRLSNASAPQKWKRKIDSPIVESAISEFIDKILKDFVVDLWYSDITPDREAPELMRTIIMDAIGELSGRVKTINLVDLLTRDVVDLIGDHLDLFRRNQAVIGVDVMRTLSSEERDERLKYHLTASKELHPALISPESEYKVLQRIMSGVLTVVLRPREAHCPIVRTMARELVTCLVIQPVMNLASPSYINELIEVILLAIRDDSNRGLSGDKRTGEMKMGDSISGQFSSLHNQGTDMIPTNFGNQREMSLDDNTSQEESVHLRAAEWAQMLEAVTQRRTEVLTPENLENMWTKGRNYKKKEQKRAEKAGVREHLGKGQGIHSAVPTTNIGGQGIHSAVPTTNMGKDVLTNRIGLSAGTGEKALLGLSPGLSLVTQISEGSKKETQLFQNFDGDLLNNTDSVGADANRSRIKKSSSTSALKTEPDSKKAFDGDGGGSIIAEFYSPDFGRSGEEHGHKNASDVMLCSDGRHCPKLKCRVMGAYFEKLGSKSFAVYSIAVTDSENRTGFVKRRYRNFERLHRHLKEFPNYTLHLPPKRIFSSSTEDAFVHQRCIQLDKYLQDLLSIANVAEQHEVWDFLSVNSKNYSFGKSSSVMRTLAVNVDDAVDDIVRQFKGVSDGLMRKVVGSPSPTDDASSISGRNLSLSTDEISKYVVRQNTSETVNSFSDNEDGDKDGSHDLQEVTSFAQGTGWHSDNELNSKGFPPRVVKRGEESRNLATQKEFSLEAKTEGIGQVGFPAASSPLIPDHLEDPAGMPPGWTPPNVSVPLLNLVDKVFQLKRRGWLRRQVFWMSKQILQLVMEDAIDDWLLRQIYCLRREDNIALGIRWLQDVLWPGGTFFTRVGNIQTKDDAQPDLKSFQAVSQLGGSKVLKPGSFEEQLEAARRASDVKKMLFDGAPTALVSLIGSKQYKRCARDIYYFTQSTVCVKQLAYAILELLILSVFPELRDLLLSLREKMPAPPA
ncbi:phox domain-containing protein [Citrus sinensis]|uniref:Phox domain-containing protein n=1 Tax=Citrus sinensis TaxID=2711 RepID=A0ACB8IFK3_CITSI|nr:phox domain-containing protein [Citrus sinensis]